MWKLITAQMSTISAGMQTVNIRWVGFGGLCDNALCIISRYLCRNTFLSYKKYLERANGPAVVDHSRRRSLVHHLGPPERQIHQEDLLISVHFSPLVRVRAEARNHSGTAWRSTVSKAVDSENH